MRFKTILVMVTNFSSSDSAIELCHNCYTTAETLDMSFRGKCLY